MIRTQRLVPVVLLLTATAGLAHAQSVACAADRVLGSFQNTTINDYFKMLDEHTVLAGSKNFIYTYDIADPAHISQLSAYHFPQGAHTAWVHGDLLFRSVNASGTTTLDLYDVHDPQNPMPLAQIQAPTLHDDFAATANHAYISGADRRGTDNTLYIYDISTPEQTMLVSTIAFPFDIKELRIDGETLFIRSYSEVHAYQLDEPTAPVKAGSSGPLGWLRGMDVRNGLVVVSHSPGASLIDFTNPASPTLLSTLELSSGGGDVSIMGAYAFVNGAFSGFFTLDIQDPAAPEILGHTQTRPYIWTLTPGDDLLFISASFLPFAIVEVQATIASPPRQHVTGGPGDYRSITIDGDRCYAAGDSNQLAVFDITDPFSPVLLNTAETSGPGRDVVIQSGFAYVAVGSGIDVFDLADPDDPIWVRVVGDTAAENLAAGGGLLAAGASAPGFVALYDIAEPASPALMGSISGLDIGYPNQMVLRDNTIYCACGYSTLSAIDVSDPHNPSIADVYYTPAFAEFSQDLALVGDLAYVGTDYGYLHILDVSDPHNLDLLSNPSISIDIRALDVAGDRLVIDDYGLHLFDITNPVQPDWIAGALSPGIKPVIRDGVVFSAAGSLGLRTIDIGDCAACPADLDNDGAHTFFDVSLFLSAFNDQDPVADLEPDGIYDFFDISAFLNAYNEGCP